MVKVFNNFWLKIIALVLGFFIWLHVITEQKYSYELTLPITVINLKENLTLSKNPPESLHVAVSASGKELLRQKWRHDGLRVDASHLSPGNHEITLNPSNTFLVNASGEVTLDNVVFPNSISLSIDDKDSTMVPVTPDVTVEPDEGFAVVQPITTKPDKVNLIGPESMLKRFKSVLTEQKELNGLRNNVTIRLALELPSSYGIEIIPDSITLNIKVIPVKTRIYENLPVVVYKAPIDRKVSTDPEFITVELTGPPDEIDLLNRKALTVSADYSLADSRMMVPIKIDCPSNFRIKKASADSVQIIVE